MLSALSASMLVIALVYNMYQRIGYRVLICLIVMLSTSVHYHFFNESVSFTYYGTAAIANLSVILFVSIFSKSPLATVIQIISFAGIIINFMGWAMYELYLGPEFYNALMFILMTMEFLRLMVRTRNDRIHDVCEADRLRHGISINDSFSGSINTSRQK